MLTDLSQTALPSAPFMTSRAEMIVALVVGAVPLLIWPFMLLANLMSLAAWSLPTGVRPSLLQTLVSQLFLWSSTLYPLVYLAAGITSVVFASTGHPPSANRFALIPLGYLLVVVLLLFAWMAVS